MWTENACLSSMLSRCRLSSSIWYEDGVNVFLLCCLYSILFWSYEHYSNAAHASLEMLMWNISYARSQTQRRVPSTANAKSGLRGYSWRDSKLWHHVGVCCKDFAVLGKRRQTPRCHIYIGRCYTHFCCEWSISDGTTLWLTPNCIADFHLCRLH